MLKKMIIPKKNNKEINRKTREIQIFKKRTDLLRQISQQYQFYTNIEMLL